jgi:hypothetical protein
MASQATAGTFSCTSGQLYEGVCCDYLMAIWTNESGQAPSCDSDNWRIKANGPMQIEAGARNRVNPDGLDHCQSPDAQRLAARYIKFNKCGSNWNDPSCTVSCSTNKNSPDLQAAGAYSGWGGCKSSPSVACVYGANKSYCDVMLDYMDDRQLSRKCDWNSCVKWVCESPQFDGQVSCDGKVITCSNGNP